MILCETILFTFMNLLRTLCLIFVRRVTSVGVFLVWSALPTDLRNHTCPCPCKNTHFFAPQRTFFTNEDQHKRDGRPKTNETVGPKQTIHPWIFRTLHRSISPARWFPNVVSTSRGTHGNTTGSQQTMPVTDANPNEAAIINSLSFLFEHTHHVY